MAQTAQFIPNMSAGKGFMALAALVFGKWRPWNAMAACLLFGFLDAVAIRLQGVSIGDFPIPVQAIEALPYILTVFLLAGFIGKAVAPRPSAPPTSRSGNSPALHAMQKARTCGQLLLFPGGRYRPGSHGLMNMAYASGAYGLAITRPSLSVRDGASPGRPGPPA